MSLQVKQKISIKCWIFKLGIWLKDKLICFVFLQFFKDQKFHHKKYYKIIVKKAFI